MTGELQAAILRYNADCMAAHERFVARHPRGEQKVDMTMSGADIVKALEAANGAWRAATRFDRYMRLVTLKFHRKHGFVPCEAASGWRLA